MSAKNQGGRPLKFKTTQDLQNKIAKYFKSCWEQKIDMFGNPIFLKDAAGKKTKKRVMVQARPYTITGLANALDVDRHTLLNYEAKQRFFTTVKRAREMCHQYAEDYLFFGKNPAGAIFNLKNNYGWQDKMALPTDDEGNPLVYGRIIMEFPNQPAQDAKTGPKN